MSSTNRPALVWGLVGSLSAFLALSAMGTLPNLGEARREYRAYLEQWEREWQRAAVLDRQCETLYRRLQERGAVVRELRAGRISLAEAACHFRSIEAAYPLDPDGSYRVEYPEGERLCLQVLSWLERPPGHRRAGSAPTGRVRELYEEMESLRGPDGAISLPH